MHSSLSFWFSSRARARCCHFEHVASFVRLVAPLEVVNVDRCTNARTRGRDCLVRPRDCERGISYECVLVEQGVRPTATTHHDQSIRMRRGSNRNVIRQEEESCDISIIGSIHSSGRSSQVELNRLIHIGTELGISRQCVCRNSYGHCRSICIYDWCSVGVEVVVLDCLRIETCLNISQSSCAGSNRGRVLVNFTCSRRDKGRQRCIGAGDSRVDSGNGGVSISYLRL